MLQEIIVRVTIAEEQHLYTLVKSYTVPRVGDDLWIANGNWKVKAVSWNLDTMVPTLYIYFDRDSEGAYWTEREFWIENGFSEELAYPLHMRGLT